MTRRSEKLKELVERERQRMKDGILQGVESIIVFYPDTSKPSEPVFFQVVRMTTLNHIGIAVTEDQPLSVMQRINQVPLTHINGKEYLVRVFARVEKGTTKN